MKKAVAFFGQICYNNEKRTATSKCRERECIMENEKKRPLIARPLLFILLAIGILNSFLPLLLEFFLFPDVVIEIVYYFCDLLSLAIECFAIGLGILHLSRKNWHGAPLSLTFVRLIAGATTMAATLLYSVFYSVVAEFDFFTVLAIYMGTAALNLLISILVDLGILLLLWLLFFWKHTLPTRFVNGAALLCLLIIKLAGLLPDTVSRFISSAPNLPPHLGSIIFDYVFLLLSLGLGYLLLCVIQAFLSDTSE